MESMADPHWNGRMLRHIYVADRLDLNNRNANKTKEIGVRMWRTAYPNSTGVADAHPRFLVELLVAHLSDYDKTTEQDLCTRVRKCENLQL